MLVVLEIHASSKYTSQKLLCAARQKERKKEKSLGQIEGMRLKLQFAKLYFQGNVSAFGEAERVTEVRGFLLVKGSLPASGLLAPSQLKLGFVLIQFRSLPQPTRPSAFSAENLPIFSSYISSECL